MQENRAISNPPESTVQTDAGGLKQSSFNKESYTYAAYEELQGKLERFERESQRIKLETIGKSALGNNLYTVSITHAREQANPKYEELRQLMDEDPAEGQKWIKNNLDVKCPIIIHASIHGTEFVGTDAALQLIERFGFAEDADTLEILDNYVLILNVNANPDGRIAATRYSGVGVDLNRDFITQAQPETKPVVAQISRLNPLVFLDLHGYVKQRGKERHPGLILPGSLPHNPNYEYDLLYKWMLKQAEVMEQHLVSEKANYANELYQTMEGTHIPLRDSEAGWDVYPPIYTPAYAMLNGSYGFTLEAPTNEWDGVKWLVDAVESALLYAVQHKEELLAGQLEIFERGITGYHPNYEGEFPKAYILEVDAEDPTPAYKAVSHLLTNGINVEKAVKPFTADGVQYQAGDYIIQLNQAKAGLANALLWEGEDISAKVETMYDVAAWSLPALWGFSVHASSELVKAEKVKVERIDWQGEVQGTGAYVIPNTSVQAVNLINKCLVHNIPVKRDQTGNFYVEAEAGNFEALVVESGLTVKSGTVPEHAETLKKLKIAILKDGGINKAQSHSGEKLALEQLGFEITEIDAFIVARGGLEHFDVFFYTGSESLISYELEEKNKGFGLSDETEFTLFKENLNRFVEAGGHFIGLGAGASKAAKSMGLTNAEVNVGPKTSNGIVKIQHQPSQLTAGYKPEDIGFIYGPVWYTDIENVEAVSFFQEENFFIAGHWKDRESASGKAVIIREKNRPVTLIGLEAGFRNHTDHLFRLLSNAVFLKAVQTKRGG